LLVRVKRFGTRSREGAKEAAKAAAKKRKGEGFVASAGRMKKDQNRFAGRIILFMI
jgi:hypothetical protein